MYPEEYKEESDYSETVQEDYGYCCGGTLSVTYRGDGSKIEHHGGPIGDVYFPPEEGLSMGL